MKYLVISALLLFGVLAGCSVQLDAWKLQQAIEQCELNGGVDYIIIQDMANEYVMCRNSFGTYITKTVK